MASDLFIWVCRWPDFQHYLPQRERGPAWIKDYTAQLDDDRYLSLTAVQRAVLHDLRIAFATSRGKLPKDTRKLSRRFALRVTKTTLEALNDAGFVEFVSREVLELRLEGLYSRSRSKKEDKEKALGRAVAGPAVNGHRGRLSEEERAANVAFARAFASGEWGVPA